MSSAGKNEGISGMGHSSSLTSMSSAGLGGRVVTERGLGIMAASVRYHVGALFVGFSWVGVIAFMRAAQPP